MMLMLRTSMVTDDTSIPKAFSACAIRVNSRGINLLRAFKDLHSTNATNIVKHTLLLLGHVFIIDQAEWVKVVLLSQLDGVLQLWRALLSIFAGKIKMMDINPKSQSIP